jgi:tight adherence protein B
MTVLAAFAVGLAVWLLVPAPLFVAVEHGARGRTRVLPLVVGLAGVLLVVPPGWLAPVLILASAGGAGTLLWRRRTAARAAEHNALLVAEVCDLLAAELSAGRPTETALDQAADAWAEIRRVAEVCRLGGDVPAAFREVSRVPGAGGLRLLAAAWTVSHRTGGGLGPATRRVAEAVRREQSTRRVVAGELASARATARLVAGLPVLALLMGSGAGADPWSVLFRTPVGLVCLAAGLAIGFLGLWWIELIAREVDR